MVIDIENLDGSIREGKDANGKSWRTKFNGAHYGELRGSLGTDGDLLDIYIKSRPDNNANKAYIVHQNHPRTHPTKGGQYDEDKVILGVSSVKAAKELYLRHYQRKDFLRSVTEMPIEAFKRAALGENKGEKVAEGFPFIRSRMREGSMKKTAVDEAYEAGVRAALDEYVKTSAVLQVPKKPKGFMTVLKKPVGAPLTVGKLPTPPKVGIA